MRFFTPISIFNAILLFQLFFLSTVLMLPIQKKKHFWIIYPACFLVSIGVAVCLPLVFINDAFLRLLFNTSMYLLISSLTFFSMKMCFQIKWRIALFTAVGSYAVQHLFSELDNLALDGIVWLFKIEGDTLALKIVIVSLFTLLSGVFLYFSVRKRRHNGELHIKSMSALLLAVFVVVVDIALSSYRGTAMFGVESESAHHIVTAFSLVSSALIVIVLLNLLEESGLQDDLITINAILKKEGEQWERSKELIEAVNIKCHDLKYRLRAARKNGIIDPAMVKDIEDEVGLYDATIHTGNEAVDVLLNEHLVYCKNNDILFSTMIDGASLDFVKLPDLYSLLGNAISNAIEAVMKIEDHQKRVINLIVKKQNGFVSLHLENYYVKVLFGEGDAPVTTKEDSANHGFGIKSMIHIVEQYNGTVSFTTEGDIFITDILMPIPF